MRHKKKKNKQKKNGEKNEKVEVKMKFDKKKLYRVYKE